MSTLLQKFSSMVREPGFDSVDPDSARLVEMHRNILLRKKMIEGVFVEFYRKCRDLDERFFSGDGLRVEVGAGSSVFKHYYPDILSTDIKQAEHLDEVLDAQKMHFKTGAVRVIYGINCFHHFPDPDCYFRELIRVLPSGGGCIFIEPYYGLLAGPIYKNLFSSEHFNKAQESWNDVGSSMGVMSGANQALSYIVFTRDRQLFEKKYPELEIVYEDVFTNYLRYLLSGGVNFRQLVPDFAIPVVKTLEALLSPMRRVLGLHHVIVIRKR